MFKKILILAAAATQAGCASVPTQPESVSLELKRFDAPPDGRAGLYIYRDSWFGAAIYKDIFVNGRCIVESAPKVFFYEEVEGDKTHLLETEGEFSRNSLRLNVASGRNYFVRQYLVVGLLAPNSELMQVSEGKGMAAIQDLALEQQGAYD